MEKPDSSSITSEQQLQEQEGMENTQIDLAEQSLISSDKWLQLHGLKSNKLTLKQILSQIGFPHCEDYVTSLGRLVASRYADGLFPQFCRAEDGRVYNLTAKSELIHHFVDCLTQVVESYRHRMAWLTSGSRQVFGVILEQCITIVLDVDDMLEEELNLCQAALVMVLQEQVTQISKFNMIRGHLVVQKRELGRAGVREDVFLIWKEMEEACSTLAQLQRLVAESPKSDVDQISCEVESGAISVEDGSNPEDNWDSMQWLQKYGLKARKLSFYDVLADCAFRHVDGIVDIKAKPEDESVKTSAETVRKTVHAKYCSRFVHAPWKDGSLVHVHVTKEKCQWYNERIHTFLAQIERRIKWLQEGSRMLFGKVLHDCVCVLIDTSHSMKGKLDLVKDKIIQLIQEQLKYKSKFNFVTFDAQAVAWHDKLADINEDNLNSAQSWVGDIEAGSSTNTLRALQIAFADKETQAIYLLTDGRPDQPPEVIIEQVKVAQKIPVYTISFNYYDEVANEFLKELAYLTGGEFHLYNFGCKDPYSPETMQNEDLTLLMREMEQGRRDLEKMQDLYSESLIIDWWYNGEKEGDNNKHRKEICSMVSASAKPQPDVESPRTSPPSMSKAQWCLSNPRILRKRVLHAEPTKTSLLRSQMSTLKSSTCNERKDVHSYGNNWSVASSDQRKPREEMRFRLLTEEHLGDKSLERSTREGSQIYDQDYLDISSENWLKTHSLVAQKLTIMDALSATAVPHNPTYVPVLDKHVVSKVFDEVFPLAHVCDNTNKMTLINPQGAKLNTYKQKVEQAIKSYEKRLNRIVWQALSEEEKERLDANKPMQYLENKAALNEALERLNWPISLKELSLLEDEILVGKMYIQQAMELQEATKKENDQQKPHGGPTKKSKSRKLDPLKGQKVIARCDENGFYFPGVVKKCVSPTHALVGFRYGDTKVVPTSFITPVGGAMPCPMLQVGDYVFAKIMIPQGFDFYVPAIVVALPNQDVPGDKFYTVLKCNNRREFCPRSALIKISQNKYTLSCSHIKSLQVQDDPKSQEEEKKNSALRMWPVKPADIGDVSELKQDRRRKKPAKELEAQEKISSALDNSSCNSQEFKPKGRPKPKVGRERHHLSPKLSDISREQYL
ncbi:von Willebrand factor A domain-containing protein 3B [Echinops telfairi]|uniref:von Willebrand factor A domain-containing protein 3B n=1 Tax=Echinops telfairi TaxID=9371 RepID=A0AC55CL52_ECHTE|nr:von Willebrand factor A domain-containing protein 3B [Echinops telfairi]